MDEFNNKDTKRSLNAFAKYSTIGFQMIGIIGLFTFIGYKIDARQHSSKPIYTAIFSLLGVCIALYQIIRQVKKSK